MEQMKASDWKQGWIGGANGYAGLPQNVSGRNYFRLQLLLSSTLFCREGYEMPVYLTFKQAP